MVNAVNANDLILHIKNRNNQRGYNVYHMNEPISVSAIDRWGARHSVAYQRPIFSLTIQERIDMARYSSMVYGIIASRMNRIGSMDWSVERVIDKIEEREGRLRDLYSIYTEWLEYSDVRAIIIRNRIAQELKQELPDLTPDMSNFKTALARYKRRIQLKDRDIADEAQNWLIEPNPDYSFEEFLKIWVWDLHVHGAFSMYKDIQDGRVENLYSLPGGTVLPVQNRYVGGTTAYVQLIPYEANPLLMFNDELCFSRWLPSTASPYGLIPLESLVNKVAEQLLFDEQAANQADGTKPPEKVVVFGDIAPFGDLDQDLQVPMEKEEQKKIELALNERRQYAIRTLSGVGQPQILDLSKADLFANQSERQRQLKEDVGLVFNASNVEMNMTGSGETSGRATSESEERVELRRGIYPILKIIEEKLNRDVLPYRFGPGLEFHFSSGLSDFEQTDLMAKMLSSGAFSVNEVRVMNGYDPFEEDDYERPPQQQVQQQPEQSDMMGMFG